MLERRNKGKRRWGLDDGFPLKDFDGIAVIAERRRRPDRRLANTVAEKRLMMLAGLPPHHGRMNKISPEKPFAAALRKHTLVKTYENKRHAKAPGK